MVKAGVVFILNFNLSAMLGKKGLVIAHFKDLSPRCVCGGGREWYSRPGVTEPGGGAEKWAAKLKLK